MPNVRIRQKISGTRDGEEWPDVGEEVSVSADDAEQLISAGIAEDAADDDTTRPAGGAPLGSRSGVAEEVAEEDVNPDAVVTKSKASGTAKKSASPPSSS